MSKNAAGVFTPQEIAKAAALYKECSPGTFNKRAVAEIVKPAMKRINADTGQINDARYMAYLLEYLVQRM